MYPSAEDGLHGIGFYEGLVYPDGKILVSYRSPKFEPLQWDADEYDWGVLNTASQKLAVFLIENVGSFHWGWPTRREEFAEMVIAKLPRDRKWRLWCSEIGHFREKIYREKEAGRDWPTCDYV